MLRKLLEWLKSTEPLDRNRLSHRKVSNRFAQNIKWVHHTFQPCQDVEISRVILGHHREALLVYNEGLCDLKRINEVVIPRLHQRYEKHRSNVIDKDFLLSYWDVTPVTAESHLEPLIEKVFGGELVLFIDGINVAYVFDVSDRPQRTPEESNTEMSIRGPRDGLIEDLIVNVALVRKRLRTNSLYYEKYTLGKRTRTQVGLLYIADVVRPQVITEIKERLRRIDDHVDSIISSTDLEEMLSPSPFSLFPLFDYSGRADYIVSALLRGRFALIVDGSPTAIIAPVNFTLLLKAPEDIQTSYLYVTFERLFRFVGTGIALFAPGFYVALTSYHQSQLPLAFLATLVQARSGVPLPTPLETVIMLVLFELFREAGIRMPHAIGQTLAVVGGLIIGDAAIRAGLTSPTLVVVVATTAVATFALVNHSVSGAVSVIRMGVLLISSLLGIFGFFLSAFALLVYMAHLRSFGVSYLAPVSPLNFRDFLFTAFRPPSSQYKKRPRFLKTADSTRRKDSK